MSSIYNGSPTGGPWKGLHVEICWPIRECKSASSRRGARRRLRARRRWSAKGLRASQKKKNEGVSTRGVDSTSSLAPGLLSAARRAPGIPARVQQPFRTQEAASTAYERRCGAVRVLAEARGAEQL